MVVLDSCIVSPICLFSVLMDSSFFVSWLERTRMKGRV